MVRRGTAALPDESIVCKHSTYNTDFYHCFLNRIFLLYIYILCIKEAAQLQKKLCTFHPNQAK
jgi:hypothetical protein